MADWSNESMFNILEKIYSNDPKERDMISQLFSWMDIYNEARDVIRKGK
jgi:hypothetical protein